MILWRTLAFTLIGPGTVTVLIPYAILTAKGGTLPAEVASARWTGVVAIVVGGAVYLRCAWDFARSGRGTPNPLDPPRRLVVGGFYRFVRNPIFLGLAAIISGEAILFGSRALLFYLLFALLAFHLRIVLFEEPNLKELFGPEYEEYLRHTPRWIPRLPRKKLL